MKRSRIIQSLLVSLLICRTPFDLAAQNTNAVADAKDAQLAEAKRLNGQVFQLWKQGKCAEALPLAQQALTIRERLLGENHPDTAQSVFNLAAQYKGMTNYTAALPLYQRALDVREKVLGPDHPETAVSLNEVAMLQEAMGAYAKAVPLYRRALNIREKVLGPEHALTAASLNNLAGLYRRMTNYTAALPLYQQALSIRGKVLGSNNVETVNTIHSLAHVHHAIGNSKDAEWFYKLSLAVTERTQGPAHSTSRKYRNCLAAFRRETGKAESDSEDLAVAEVKDVFERLSALQKQGKHAEALPLAKRALEIGKQHLGENHPATATGMVLLAWIYSGLHDYKAAEPLYQRALEIQDKVLGPYHRDTLTTVKGLADAYEGMGNHAGALPLLERHLAANEKIHGANHFNTAKSLNNLAFLHAKNGNYSKAEPLYRRALCITEAARGKEHPDTASCLNNLATLYGDMSDHAKALPLHLRALSIREKMLGPNHLDTAGSLNNLGLLYRATGNFAKALPLLQRALNIREEASGPDHPATATALNNLAELYGDLSGHAKALPLHLRALSIREKILGAEHPEVAGSLANLAAFYVKVGDYAKGQSFGQQAMRLCEKTLGPEHPTTVTCLRNLAVIYNESGDYAKAELLGQQALRISEKAQGAESAGMALSLDHLAGLYMKMGDYTKAHSFFQRGLNIHEKVFGSEHPDTAHSLNNLASLYRDMGDYAKALPLHLRALSIREKAFGPGHPSTANSLNNLAELYRGMGDPLAAQPLLQRALSIREKVLGPEHPDTATSLHNLAALYKDLRDYPKAQSLYERALNICEKVLGPDHPNTASSLASLASLYHAMGDNTKAQRFYERALSIQEKEMGPDHPNTATNLNNLAGLFKETGDLAKAQLLFERVLASSERVLGLDHPDTATSRSNLATLYIDSGKNAEATTLALRNRQSLETRMAEVLSFASERQRLAFQKHFHPYALLATLGRTPELAEAILRYKGVVLDSLLEDRLVAQASSKAEIRDMVGQLQAAKRRQMQLLLQVPKDISDAARQRRETEKATLDKQVEELEMALARHVAGLGRARRAFSVTVRDVQNALAHDQVLVEWLFHGHYLGKGDLELRFGALMIAANGEPRWISLGRALPLAKKAIEYKFLIRGGSNEASASALLKDLHQQLWAPIEKVLPAGTKTVIISPDGELNFISFATLLTPDDQFLGHKYSIRYVASGRDLLRETKPAAARVLSVFANPDFNKGQEVSGKGEAEEGKREAASGKGSVLASSPLPLGPSVSLRTLEMRDFRGLTLPPLPGTALESARLEALAKQSGWPAEIHLGANATEPELQQVRSPHILHLATHGFFLPETEEEKDGGLRSGERSYMTERGVGGISPIEEFGGERMRPVALKNPMHRSGLALAGAQRTLEAWARGEVPPTDNDGIVTAEEVGGLKLDGTWLVVLSACDTGTGEARAGEGVLGLRRGFIQAGAQNLLMTLWAVADEETVKLMTDFYAAAQTSRNAPQALANVQRDWLVRLRRERGLQTAIRIAGPFIMSSQGPVQ